jgi:hypothetical protein
MLVTMRAQDTIIFNSSGLGSRVDRIRVRTDYASRACNVQFGYSKLAKAIVAHWFDCANS